MTMTLVAGTHSKVLRRPSRVNPYLFVQWSKTDANGEVANILARNGKPVKVN